MASWGDGWGDEEAWEEEWEGGYDDWDDFGAQGRAGGSGRSGSCSWYQGRGRLERHREQPGLGASLAGHTVALLTISGERACLFLASGRKARLIRTVKPQGRGTVTATCSRRGGQSAARFQRQAEQGRAAWVVRVAEAAQLVVHREPVSAISICGGAGLRRMLADELAKDPRIARLVVHGPATDPQAHEVLELCAAALAQVGPAQVAEPSLEEDESSKASRAATYYGQISNESQPGVEAETAGAGAEQAGEPWPGLLELKSSVSFYLGPGSSRRVQAVAEVHEDEPTDQPGLILPCVGSTVLIQNATSARR